MQFELAPVGISVYTRVSHFKMTVNALANNALASQTIVYVFSDHGILASDRLKVGEIREYAKNIKHFKRLILIERDHNIGASENTNKGIEFVLEKHGKMIFMEDDIVTAPGFLQYMNQGLEFYKCNPKILSISGYSPPFVRDMLEEDVFFLPRYCAWGVGLWKHKFNLVKLISFDEYSHFMKDKVGRKLFIHGGGKDMLKLLELEVNGQIDAYDVRAMFYMFKSEMLAVYPALSLVQNIGHDSSGLHCGTTNRFYHDALWSKQGEFKFSESTIVNEQIRQDNFNFRNYGLKRKLGDFIKLCAQHPIFRFLIGKLV